MSEEGPRSRFDAEARARVTDGAPQFEAGAGIRIAAIVPHADFDRGSRHPIFVGELPRALEDETKAAYIRFRPFEAVAVAGHRVRFRSHPKQVGLDRERQPVRRAGREQLTPRAHRSHAHGDVGPDPFACAAIAGGPGQRQPARAVAQQRPDIDPFAQPQSAVRMDRRQ